VCARFSETAKRGKTPDADLVVASEVL